MEIEETIEEPSSNEEKSPYNWQVIIGLVLLFIFCGAAIFGFAWYGLSVFKDKNSTCILEARQCPDGSYVGRIPPSCEFAKCLPIPKNKDCKQLGENRHESDPKCCPGLVERNEKGIYGDKCLPLPNIGISLPICIACGDGVCNGKLENECNCPEDCKNRTCKPVGEDSNCDRSCQLDSDCFYTCGCGAINKNESCDDSEAIFDCGYSRVECQNNLCVVVGDAKYPWENSVCGNGICEICESSEECCNYPCSGQACPPPSCEGHCPEDCSSKACVKAGVYVDHPDKDSFECCPGLSKASALPLDENCKVIIPENSPGIEPGWTCLNCGDAICDKEKNENKCNCPEDCGEEASNSE